MMGIIKNDGPPVFIFQRKFAAGHSILIKDLWAQYEKRVRKTHGDAEVSEEVFVKWLRDNKYMKPEFQYIPVATASLTELESTNPETKNKGVPERGVVERPSLATASSRAIEKLTYREIANLKLSDDPARVLSVLYSVPKLRRAYQVVRSMPRKRRLEKILRERIQALERL